MRRGGGFGFARGWGRSGVVGRDAIVGVGVEHGW